MPESTRIKIIAKNPSEFKCTNCNETCHTAVSKSCPKLKQAVDEKKKKLENNINKNTNEQNFFTRIESASNQYQYVNRQPK